MRLANLQHFRQKTKMDATEVEQSVKSIKQTGYSKCLIYQLTTALRLYGSTSHNVHCYAWL